MKQSMCSMWPARNGAVIITKDEDFAIRASVSKTPPAIVWVRIGNCPNTKLLTWFERELTTIIAMLKSANQLVEISDKRSRTTRWSRSLVNSSPGMSNVQCLTPPLCT